MQTALRFLQVVHRRAVAGSGLPPLTFNGHTLSFSGVALTFTQP